MNRVLMAAAVLSLATLAAHEGLAQHPPRKYAAGTGGGGGGGGGLILRGTFGQSTAGSAGSAVHRASIGFWGGMPRALTLSESPIAGRATGTAMTLHASPNPFTSGTDIRISAPAGVPVVLTLHDALGRRVMTMLDGERAAGDVRTIHVDGGDLPSGRYTATLVSGAEQLTISLLLVR